MAQCVTECVAECDLQHNGSDLDNGEDSLQKKCPSGEAKAGFRKSNNWKGKIWRFRAISFHSQINFFLFDSIS